MGIPLERDPCSAAKTTLSLVELCKPMVGFVNGNDLQNSDLLILTVGMGMGENGYSTAVMMCKFQNGREWE